MSKGELDGHTCSLNMGIPWGLTILIREEKKIQVSCLQLLYVILLLDSSLRDKTESYCGLKKKRAAVRAE